MKVFILPDIFFLTIICYYDSLFYCDNESMSEYKLEEILEKGMKFIHEYDFGSTTKLKITVLDKYNPDQSFPTLVLNDGKDVILGFEEEEIEAAIARA